MLGFRKFKFFIHSQSKKDKKKDQNRIKISKILINIASSNKDVTSMEAFGGFWRLQQWNIYITVCVRYIYFKGSNLEALLHFNQESIIKKIFCEHKFSIMTKLHISEIFSTHCGMVEQFFPLLGGPHDICVCVWGSITIRGCSHTALNQSRRNWGQEGQNLTNQLNLF